jgi:hypothetical protein
MEPGADEGVCRPHNDGARPLEHLRGEAVNLGLAITITVHR